MKKKLIHQPANINETITAIQTTLKQMAQWGCPGFDLSKETLTKLKKWEQPDTPEETGAESLDQIRSHLIDCRRCNLASERTQIVFGSGAPKARLVFVSERPGEGEDCQGLPLTGDAGELLAKIIQAMKLTPEEVYICNLVKCRTPGNRNPSSDEINSCLPFLKRQLSAIDPEVICTLGNLASQALLHTDDPVSKLRGRFHTYGDTTKIMPTFHPEDLLRKPDRKRAVWNDMKKIMALLRIPL